MMSDLEHYDRWDIEEPPDRGSNNVHEWVYTGTNYGDDDPRWNGEGRCYCIECGADGDASCQTMCEPIDVLCQRHRPLPDGQPLILSAAAPNAGAIPRRCPMNNCRYLRTAFPHAHAGDHLRMHRTIHDNRGIAGPRAVTAPCRRLGIAFFTGEKFACRLMMEGAS